MTFQQTLIQKVKVLQTLYLCGLQDFFNLAGVEGLEPSQTVLETEND